MKYRLTVESVEPVTGAELEQMQRNDRFRGETVAPEKLIRTLVAELTETEWQAVKKAVVEAM